WYLQASPHLSEPARAALEEAEGTEGIVVSVATLVDLWYVTQTTRSVTVADLRRLRDQLATAPRIKLHPIDIAVVDAVIEIPRDRLADPWDRFIVATAKVLSLPLVTRDSGIRDAAVVQTTW
ncbi:MAG: PIN domain-containing protein, partial [Acidimicrobiia bacterium]|nr:PIN domain-containing protein [Acidimicrobiia bacterium]